MATAGPTPNSGCDSSVDESASASVVGDWEEPLEELVLREFSMPPTQGSPGAYARMVQSECFREGGETASVVRWHVSHADDKTGQARVEVRAENIILGFIWIVSWSHYCFSIGCSIYVGTAAAAALCCLAFFFIYFFWPVCQE